MPRIGITGGGLGLGTARIKLSGGGGEVVPTWTPAEATTEGAALPLVWWKADAELYQDTAMTTLAGSADDPVGAWADQSDNGHDLLRVSSDDNRPLLKLSVVNGLPALYFDGTNDRMVRVLGAALSQPFNIFWSGALDADAAADGADHVAISSDDSTNLTLLYKHGSTKRWYTLANNVLAGSLADANWHAFGHLLNATSSEAWIDGVSMAFGDAGVKNLDGIVVGALWTGATFWKGHIGEILIYDPSLSDADRQQVEQYLMRRWDDTAGGTTFDVGADSLHDNGYTTDATAYLRSSPMARWVFNTTATFMRLNFFSNANMYSVFPAWTEIVVLVNGAYHATLAAAAAASQTAEITLPAGSKVVELVAGLQSNPSGTVLGTFLRSVYFDGGTTTEVAPTQPANRVVIYGDSIAVGADAATPTSEGWPVLLRADIPVAVEAWGYRSLHADANTPELRAALVAKLASFAPGSVWLAIGTNDYGLAPWTAANFGTAYAALLDDLNTALPDAVIYCQTPITRSTETANAMGSTMAEYRTAISDAVSTRTAYATLVDGTAWTITRSDGVHPTTAGHAAYYAGVAAVLGL